LNNIIQLKGVVQANVFTMSLSQHNFTFPLLLNFALACSVWQSNGEMKQLKLNLLNLCLTLY